MIHLFLHSLSRFSKLTLYSKSNEYEEAAFKAYTEASKSLKNVDDIM